MKLYHGSNTEIKVIDLTKSREDIDFGCGFYLTSSFDQASRFARNIVKRRENAGELTLLEPIVSQFEWQNSDGDLSVKTFEGADREWLDFVSLNRQLEYVGETFDVVIGPVANDQTTPVILEYLASGRTEDDVAIALLRLKSQKLVDQYVFKSEAAVGDLVPLGRVDVG